MKGTISFIAGMILGVSIGVYLDDKKRSKFRKIIEKQAANIYNDYKEHWIGEFLKLKKRLKAKLL